MTFCTHTVNTKEKYDSILDRRCIFPRANRTETHPLDQLAGDKDCVFFRLGMRPYHANGFGFGFDAHKLIDKYDAVVGIDLCTYYDAIAQAWGVPAFQFESLSNEHHRKHFSKFASDAGAMAFYLPAARQLQATMRASGSEAHQLVNISVERGWESGIELVTAVEVAIADAIFTGECQKREWKPTLQIQKAARQSVW